MASQTSLQARTQYLTDPLIQFIQKGLFGCPELVDCQEHLALVLAGSRAVNYAVPTSDYDILGLCDAETYARLLQRTGRRPTVGGIDIPLDRETVKAQFDLEVDVAIYEVSQIQRAFAAYNDRVLWIWTNAKPLLDPHQRVAALQASFQGYPREILRQKLQDHFLQDFHLSVHGLTYRPESQNTFAILNTLTSKIGEMCKLCCLLDNKPFPYEKWLLRASADTPVGEQLAPFFARVLATLSTLNGDLPTHWPAVRAAIDALDTDACTILEEALVAWGLEPDWLAQAYYERHTVLLHS